MQMAPPMVRPSQRRGLFGFRIRLRRTFAWSRDALLIVAKRSSVPRKHIKAIGKGTVVAHQQWQDKRYLRSCGGFAENGRCLLPVFKRKFFERNGSVTFDAAD